MKVFLAVTPPTTNAPPPPGITITLDTIVLGGMGLVFTVTIAVFKGLLDRVVKDHDKRFENLGSITGKSQEKIQDLERQLLELKATLPTEYVHREDWIRFANTIDAKIDNLGSNLGRRLEGLQAEISGIRRGS